MFLGLSIRQWIDVAISLLIIVVSIPLSHWLTEFVTHRILSRFTAQTKTTLDDRLIQIVHIPLQWIVIVAIAEVAVMRLNFLERETRQLIGDIAFVLYAGIGLLLMARIVAVFFGWKEEQLKSRMDPMVDENLMPVARRLTIVALSLIGLSIVLSHFSVDVSGLVATLGIGSLALALAAQAALGDTISGFVIMVDRPFRVGDRIEILDLDTWGNVVDIGLRSSRIVTQDNRMVIVPNSVIGRSLIVNHSFPDSHYRLETHVGVAYGTDIDEAREVIINAVQAAEGVMDEKRVEGLFMEFGDSALVFRVRWWIQSYVDYYVMYDRVNSAIYRALNEAGIGIPFPQRDVHHYVDTNAIPNIEWVTRSGRGGRE